MTECPEVTTEAAIEAGTMIGEYEVVELIGEGGMGHVYLAVHPVIAKRAAVKVLRPEVARDEDLVARFATEARAVNNIDHQNIIDVFAFGKLPDGRQYYVMEYLDGESLEDRLQREPRLEHALCLDFLRQVADALDAAHERQIIHRDLKPENIYLVPRRSGKTRAVVLDFGIAKLGQGTTTTASGLVMGTPLYMSPEQCLGRSLDNRTDVYAMGIILYRMLTGRLPFFAESVQAVMYQQISNQAAPPSHFGAPAETDPILMRALAKDPQWRYPSIGSMVDELAAVLGGGQPSDDWCENTKPMGLKGPGGNTPRGKGKGKKGGARGKTTACIVAMSPVRFEGHQQAIHQVAYCPAGGLLASAGDDQTVRLWSYDGRELMVFRGHDDKVEHLAFSPHGHLLASTGSDGRVLVWSIYGGDLLRELRGHRGKVNALAFSPDGETLLTGGSDATLRQWNVASDHGQMLSGHTGPVRAVAFSASGRAIASASDDRSVRLWRDGCGKREVLTGHRRAVYSVAFSPDCQYLASGGHDGCVHVWRVRDGEATVLKGHHGIVWHVAYSPNGRILASSSSDCTVRLWTQGGEYQVLEGHEKKVRESVFSPDGKKLASVSVDGTVRLWDVDSGQCLSILSHSGPARSAAFTPQGDWVASASGRSSLVMTPISASEVAAARGT